MDRIEKVARAMCRAHGVDPDEEIEIEVHHAPPEKDGVQFLVYCPPSKKIVRRWEQSRALAFDAVIAHDAIKEADRTPEGRDILCPFCGAPWSDANVSLYDLDASDRCDSGRFSPETATVSITCHACGKLMYRKEGMEFD